MKNLLTISLLIISQAIFAQIDTLWHKTLSTYSHNSSNYTSKNNPVQFIYSKDEIIIYTQDNKLIKLDSEGKVIFIKDNSTTDKSLHHSYISVNDSSEIFFNTSKQLYQFNSDGSLINKFQLDDDPKKRFNLNVCSIDSDKVLLIGTNHYIYPHKGFYMTTLLNIRSRKKHEEKIKSKKFKYLKASEWKLQVFKGSKRNLLIAFYNHILNKSLLLDIGLNQKVNEEKVFSGKVKDVIQDGNSIDIIVEDFNSYFSFAIISLTNSLKDKKQTQYFSLPYNGKCHKQELAYFNESNPKQTRYINQDFDCRDYQIKHILKPNSGKIYVSGSSNKSPFIYDPSSNTSFTTNNLKNGNESIIYSEINQIEEIDNFLIVSGIKEKWKKFKFTVDIELFIQKININ